MQQAAFGSFAVTGAESADYSILSIDGGGIKGLISAVVLDNMEREAYNIALEKKYITERTNKKVSMAELFDMVAGTSSGGLLAGSIVLPKAPGSKEAKYFASDYLNDLSLRSDIMFVRPQFDWSVMFLIMGATFFLFFGLGYLWGVKKYQNKDTEKLQANLREYIRKLKYKNLQNRSNTMTEKEAKSSFKQSITDKLGNALLAQYDDLGDFQVLGEDGNLIHQKLQGGSREDLIEA